MNGILRVIDTGVQSARWNVAATAAMLELHQQGRIPVTLRFHRSPGAFLLGRNQDCGQELDVGRCHARGVEIARRLTGGAALYVDRHILAWDLVAGRGEFGAGMAGMSERVCSTIGRGLGRLGVPVRSGRSGDLLVDRRKIGGAAGCAEGPSLVLQGAIMLDLHRADMAGLFRKDSETRRMRIRLASLRECLGVTPPVGRVKAALVAELVNEWSLRPAFDRFSAQERALTDTLLAPADDDDFDGHHAAAARTPSDAAFERGRAPE